MQTPLQVSCMPPGELWILWVMKGGVIFKKIPTTYEYMESRFKQLLEYLRLNYWYVAEH